MIAPDSTALAGIAALEPDVILDSLDQQGFFVTTSILDAKHCAALARLYAGDEAVFRATVTMARHGFGKGEYKYFAQPLPDLVNSLRQALYARLAPIANAWDARLGRAADWPADHGCTEKSTFPLQAIALLDRPGVDFRGGELVLVEQRPRRQSVPIVLPLAQGAFALIPVKERPVQGVRGTSKVKVRHGVSRVHSGLRRTLGLIFHDAA